MDDSANNLQPGGLAISSRAIGEAVPSEASRKNVPCRNPLGRRAKSLHPIGGMDQLADQRKGDLSRLLLC